MAVFISWADELAKWKNAIANRDPDSYFVQSSENSRQMRNTYTLLGNVTKFTEWLEAKAAEEEAGYSPGSIFTAIGGC